MDVSLWTPSPWCLGGLVSQFFGSFRLDQDGSMLELCSFHILTGLFCPNVNILIS